MRRLFLFILLALGGATLAVARPFIVLVYNVENLFDADGKAQFEDYQPARYSRQHVLTKVENVAKVVSQFEHGHGPDIIMFEEIEVDETPSPTAPDYDAILSHYAGMTAADMLGAKFDAAIADLPAEALLAKAMADRGMTGYHIVAAEDIRAAGSTHGLAQKCVIFTRFPVVKAISHPTLDARAILEVQVMVDGAKLYLFDNHWKSGAGDPKTEPIRVANARTLRTRLDEILQEDPHADIIIGGDFNSQYNQKARYKAMKETGINDVLGSQGNELAIRGKQRDLYNLWFELPADERGSDTYKGEWGTLMQMIITRGLYDYNGVQYVDDSFGVAKVAGLNMDDAGLPVRWSFDGPAGRGFSDHFPVYAKFITVTDHQPDRYISLSNPSEESGLASINKVSFDKIDLAKVALTLEQVPAGENLRQEKFKGRIVRVDGTVGRSKRLTVEVRHDIYDVWSFDRALRDKLRADFKEGDAIRFYGELDQYKGRWQFVIRDASWVK